MKTWMKDAIAILLLTLFFVAIMTYRQYCITPDIDDLLMLLVTLHVLNQVLHYSCVI